LRLGVLGGSFNPPHNGHLIIASDAFEALGLDRLLVVPANANPLKGHDADGASPQQRLEMAGLAFGEDPRFEVSSMEIERAGLSFTVDTLEALKAANPGAELVLIIGMDAYRSLDKWKDPDRIRRLARLAVLARMDVGPEPGELPDDVQVVTTRRVDVSSTEVRARLADGKPIKGFVAESVERYIAAAKLYGARA
jgi:nicotinate-nucleotide adenylyltransferase